MSVSKIITIIACTALLAACAPTAQEPIYFPTYDPFLPANSNTQAPQEVSSASTISASPQPLTSTATPIPTATATRPPTPTRVPLSISALFGIQNQIIVASPTPDAGRILPTPRQETLQYTVQPGDTLGGIAQQYNVGLQALLDANQISNPDALEVGAVLTIPSSQPSISTSSALKIIPDAELVHSPSVIDFKLRNFIASQNGYLSHYTQEVNGVRLNGADIIEAVAYNYSVNPRILLAVLEYHSGWVTNPTPTNIDYPFGYLDPNRAGLYRQTMWAANTLNRGYYLWRANGISTLVLADGQVVPMDPTINAGTAAVQYFFSELYGYEAWMKSIKETGVVVTYYVFFGNPFNYAIEPLVPPNLSQPAMSLPFPSDEKWYFTGGPHGGWDSGSAWGALDFAPPDNPGCAASTHWVTAMADGLITRTGIGSVIQDLDNDGYEQTGWVLVYMHIAGQGRAQTGEYIFQNEKVGHPSCEGGFSNATHVHVARKYNGEWIAGDGALPFNLDGWVSSGDTIEYNGYLTRGSVSIEAWDGAQEINLIGR